MAMDKNLFLYDLAVVAIMKNEAPYVKEWLDYHLLAGVDHFFIYDNDSPDNLKQVLQPYINDGLVTYKFYPGKARQYEAYNEAIQDYKFFCKYMAFIDADEFIFPQNNKSVPEVVNEILDSQTQFAGLAVNIFWFGSNNLEKADYSKGVLERFTRRAPDDWVPPIPEIQNLPGGNAHVSSIVNPRKVHHFGSSHFAFYFDGYYAVNSNGKRVPAFYNNPPTLDKIVMNHYSVKSKEEYLKKINRGTADNKNNIYNSTMLNKYDQNGFFDDRILKYLASRQTVVLERYSEKYNRVFLSILQNLTPIFTKNVPANAFTYKMETFLACRKLSEYLREFVVDEDTGNFLEESSLKAIQKALSANIRISDFSLLLFELPNILKLKYPVVKEIYETFMNTIPKVMDLYRKPLIEGWQEFIKWQYLMKMLPLIDINKD